MKKLLLICLVSLTLLNAKESVKFNFADKNLDRVFPTKQEHILSYNNVLKNVRTSVVNISTQKNLHIQSTQMPPMMDNPFFREFFRGHPMIPKDKTFVVSK